jgi:hypothetical protein
MDAKGSSFWIKLRSRRKTGTTMVSSMQPLPERHICQSPDSKVEVRRYQKLRNPLLVLRHEAFSQEIAHFLTEPIS